LINLDEAVIAINIGCAFFGEEQEILWCTGEYIRFPISVYVMAGV